MKSPDIKARRPKVRKPVEKRLRSAVLVAGVLMLALSGRGCQSGFQRIDRKVDALVNNARTALGPDAYPPSTPPPPDTAKLDRRSPAVAEQPPTVNPAADQLPYRAISDANDVL